MDVTNVSFCLADQVSTCRSKSSFHFLESPVGVGATLSRPYISKEWDRSWCPFCSGLGTCLGPGCLGPKTTATTRPAQFEGGTGTEIPGLEGLFKATTLVSQSLTKTRAENISSFKYPCYIPSKRNQDVPSPKPAKSNIQFQVISFISWCI